MTIPRPVASRRPFPPLALLALLLGAVPLLASQPQFWRIEGARDFLDGDSEGLTIDSVGRVRLAPASRTLFDPESLFVWSLARDAKGHIYAGTGNDGKVFRVEAGKGPAKGALFHDAAELEVHALAVGHDGRLYAGTSPDGKVYAIDAGGKAEEFYDPADRYVWALAFDPAGNLFVATGAEGKVHRVDRHGKGQVVLTTPEAHVMALAVDEKGNLFAGSSPSGIVYRIDSSLKVSVLHDSGYREVKALATGSDGVVYAAVIDGRDEPAPRAAPQPALSLPATSAVPEGFVGESVTPLPQTSPPPSPPPPLRDLSRPGAAKGAVLRVLGSGDVETLWSSNDDTPHALVRTADGLLVGTGNKGKLYRVRDDRTWSMVAAFPAEQVTGLHLAAGGAIALATSNPGKIFTLEAVPGAKGTFTSKPRDTDTLSSWGRLRWEATLPAGTEVQVQTRSGNTGTPDSTWSEWSAPYTRPDGDPVTSGRARFIQVRAVLIGKDGASPLLDSVSTAYLQRNLRPQVQTITVHPPGEVFQKPLSVTGEVEILGLEPGQAAETRPGAPSPRPLSMPATAYGRRLYQRGIQTLSWRAEDPNGDSLVYDVHYRASKDTRFRLLRRRLSDPVLAWDTSTVPNGRYVVRITASDSPGNPEELALTGDKESTPFDVDNTPPSIVLTLVQRSRAQIRAVVKDDYSLIRKAEFTTDGGRWQEIHPSDGINDALEETYTIDPGDLEPAGPHIVVVRATDLLGNVSSARIEVVSK